VHRSRGPEGVRGGGPDIIMTLKREETLPSPLTMCGRGGLNSSLPCQEGSRIQEQFERVVSSTQDQGSKSTGPPSLAGRDRVRQSAADVYTSPYPQCRKGKKRRAKKKRKEEEK